jgi:predicted Zn finger-like uncharacterized protein
MILTCPDCSTRYLIDPTVLGTEGRMVRCSNCDNSWVQIPPEDQAPPEPVPAPTETPDQFDGAAAARRARRAAGSREPAAAPRRRGGRTAAAMWTLLVVAIVGVLGGGFALRDVVIQTWPAAESLYRLAGIHDGVSTTGLDLRNASQKWSSRDGVRVLTVEGEVVNVSEDVREVPEIQGVLFDKDNRELQRWTFSAPESRLLPGENVVFRTELENPAAGATKLTVVFAQ